LDKWILKHSFFTCQDKKSISSESLYLRVHKKKSTEFMTLIRIFTGNDRKKKTL
jgi:hypothetical protein